MWEIGDIVYRIQNNTVGVYKICKINDCKSIPYILATIENCLIYEIESVCLHRDKQCCVTYGNVTFTSDIEYVKQLINN
jgi:hypothetical protein